MDVAEEHQRPLEHGVLQSEKMPSERRQREERPGEKPLRRQLACAGSVGDPIDEVIEEDVDEGSPGVDESDRRDERHRFPAEETPRYPLVTRSQLENEERRRRRYRPAL